MLSLPRWRVMRCSRYASSSVALGLTSVPSPLAPPTSGRFLQRADGRRQRVLPRDLDPLAVVLDARLQQPVVAVDAVAAEAVAIRDPALVDRLVLARHDAAQLAAQHVRIEIAAGAVVRAHERLRDHLPRARAVAVRLVVQRADGAQIDDVAARARDRRSSLYRCRSPSGRCGSSRRALGCRRSPRRTARSACNGCSASCPSTRAAPSSCL